MFWALRAAPTLAILGLLVPGLLNCDEAKMEVH